MNSRQFVSGLPLGPGDPRANLFYARLLVSYFAERIYVAELANGVEVHDVTDVAKFCGEVIEEARKIGQLPGSTEASLRLDSRTPPPQLRYDPPSCPDCFHVHGQKDKCGYYLGEGNFCHCPSKAAA